jgi:hypothetical protein
MPNPADFRRILREATEQFLVGDAPALAAELTDALILVSARVANLRRRAPRTGPLAEEVRAVDEAFGRSVVLVRELSTAIRAHRDPGAYVAAGDIVRELGRQLAVSLPEGTALTIRCSSNPALATISPSELRRVLVTLIRRTVDGMGEGGCELVIEVSEVMEARATETLEPAIRIVVRHDALLAAAAADAADQVRDMVNARGGSVQPCATTGRGAAVVVSLRAAC